MTSDARPMDADPGVTQCPLEVCWKAMTCQRPPTPNACLPDRPEET